jgi:hypothetical protein
MSVKHVKITARPSHRVRAEAWIQERSGRRESDPSPKGVLFTARLTIDVTPALRSRIKVAAFQGGTTVAELVRELLEESFPDSKGSSAS